MGVPGLWELLRPFAERKRLMYDVVVEGLMRRHAHNGQYRVGIDISGWFFHAVCGTGGKNPQLRLIFFRLARFLKIPCLPLVVFDGACRPGLKRGKRVVARRFQLEQATKELVKAFGFHWIDAPGEAEAELAYLNRIGVIDAVLTDDVDALLFGAEVILRNPSNSGRSYEHVLVYNAKDISSDGVLGLSRPGMILIAVLSGGDYDQAGLPGCGSHVAYALARAGLGEKLLEALRYPSGGDLDAHLAAWRDDVKNELRTNCSGYLKRKYQILANKLSEDFPDPAIVRLYTDPVTSEKRRRGNINTSAWWSTPADVGQLAILCRKCFGWDSTTEVIQRVERVLWPGICVASMREYRGSVDWAERLIKGIKRHRIVPITPQMIEFQLITDTQPLRKLTLARMKSHGRVNVQSHAVGENRKKQVKPRWNGYIWVPAAVVYRALPIIVEYYCCYVAKNPKLYDEVQNGHKWLFN